jgi:hypothetical protein
MPVNFISDWISQRKIKKQLHECIYMAIYDNSQGYINLDLQLNAAAYLDSSLYYMILCRYDYAA